MKKCPLNPGFIELKSVATNNLKNIDVAFPLDQITVVTGVSGSGKSSLVFDTLYGESYRRYTESLSSFARQYLQALPKPDLSEAINLLPAIAVRQARMASYPRSTVGSLTEISDLLRVVFSYLAKIYCPVCQKSIRKDSPQNILADLFDRGSSHKITLASPLSSWKELHSKQKDFLALLISQGFSKTMLGSKILPLENLTAGDLKKCLIIIDSVTIEPKNKTRLANSLDTALKVGRGKISVFEDEKKIAAYSIQLECEEDHLLFHEPTPGLFSFNHPLGACPTCQGFGLIPEVAWDKVIPDQTKSLSDQGIKPWNFGSHVEFYDHAKESAKKYKIDIKKPFSRYSPEEWHWLKNGLDKKFGGIFGYFKWLESKRYKPHYRIHAARFRKYAICPSCQGKRLNQNALSCKIGKNDISDVHNLSLKRFSHWLEEIEELASTSQVSKDGSSGVAMGLAEAMEELRTRTNYLLKIGVGYLSLSRQAKTLSGGELQRINMAKCLGSALTNILYCLDEPTAGLHARDSANLLEILHELRDQGNTVVVVDHDRSIIQGSDHVIELGPGSGHLGGRVVYSGNEIKYDPQTMIKDKLPPTNNLRSFIELIGAKTNNLKNISIKIPVNSLTTVCGVSGSGKTILMQHTFYPMASAMLDQEMENSLLLGAAEEIKPAAIIKEFSEVSLVSQTPMGRSSRSNIATYLGIFEEIRRLFASTPEAKQLNLTPGYFSFNTPGGRCETCHGLGTVVEDLSFLGEMEIICPSCLGNRFLDEILGVTYRKKSLIEVLKMTVAEARAFFFDRPNMVAILDEVINFGLGYLTLGQGTSSFSGGEAQRLKLLSYLKNTLTSSKPSLLILDEPSSGLSDKDVANLIRQFRIMISRGHTIIVVEHHLDIIFQSDWIIELGPEAGDQGGELIYQGTPSGLGKIKNSPTGKFMNITHKEIYP